MNFSDIKRVGFLILIGLLVLLLAAGFLLRSDLFNRPDQPTPPSGEPQSMNSLNQPSPDGEYTAGVSAVDKGMGGSQITLAREGAKDVQVIAGGDEDSWVTNPVWSPDGKNLAYLRVVNAQISVYEIDSNFELWVYDLKSAQSRLITDSSNLNPSISFDGNSDLKWVSNTKIQYPDNEAFPIVFYTVDIITLETTSEVSQPKGDTNTVSTKAQPVAVPYFSQCGTPWSGTVLGTCSQYTVCQQGCAISSVSMIFKYFGVSTDPGLMNTWLKSHGGYFSGCLINWTVAANLAADKLTFVARVDNQDWARLHYELDSGFPVIIEVPFSYGQHFVVATGYSGDTVFINDPYYSSRTTLASYGNSFKGLRIYHGPTSTQATCPASTDTQVYNCTPYVTPAYGNDSCKSSWYPITGFNGNPTYLVENASTAATSTNRGRWTPTLPKTGRYKVEAYIAAHGTFSKVCSTGSLTFGADSSKARYVIHSMYGTVTEVFRDQLPLNNQWLNLGEYSFYAGSSGYVTLSDLTGEPESSRNVSFGAMRFTLVGPPDNPVPKIYQLTPGLKPAGTKSFTIKVIGTGFLPESVARWNGKNLPTTFINATTLLATISADDRSIPGLAEVSVFNPTPGGGESAAVIFPIITMTPWKLDQLTTSKATFDWDDISGADLYIIQLSTERDFSTLVIQATTVESTYFYDAFLKDSTLYYWRIKYRVGGTWADWSPAWIFTSMDPLAAPVLTAPDHKFQVNVNRPTLTWSDVPNAATYRVVVARDLTFIDKVKDKTVNTASVSINLPDGKYFWRVRAIDLYGRKGPWSEVRIFKVLVPVIE